MGGEAPRGTWRHRLWAVWNVLRGRPTIYRVSFTRPVRIGPSVRGLFMTDCTVLCGDLADAVVIEGWEE